MFSSPLCLCAESVILGAVRLVGSSHWSLGTVAAVGLGKQALLHICGALALDAFLRRALS